MSDTPENEIPEPPADLASDVADEAVEARFDVAVLPDENVSIHYTVWPKDESNAILSVTAAFVLERDGMVVHDFAGATTAELKEPRDGQGATGNVGVDVRVFGGDHPEGKLMALLTGTVRVGEEGDSLSYFFKRPVDLTVFENPADEAGEAEADDDSGDDGDD